MDLYAKSPQSAALARMLCDEKVKTGYVDGSVSSAVPVLFASVARSAGRSCLFVLDDAEEAGYFYHDLTQMLGNRDVLFFPSSYRRQVKYGQRDSANEILRTEVLGRLLQATSNSPGGGALGYLHCIGSPPTGGIEGGQCFLHHPWHPAPRGRAGGVDEALHFLLREAVAGHDFQQKPLVVVRDVAQVVGQAVQLGVALARRGFAARQREPLADDFRVRDALEF